jgi:opacity protein-like surface antigen
MSVLLLALPSVARAEFFAVPFAGMKFGGSTSIADFELAAGQKKFVLGAAARWTSDGILGFEVEFSNIAGYFSNEETASIIGPLVKPGSYVNDLTGSVVLSLPPSFTGGGLRPYAVIGAGLIHASTEDIVEIVKVRRTVAALNLGIGAVGMFTNNVGVRFDVRHLRSLTRDAPTGGVGHSISYSRFTIGLLLRP